MSHIGGTKVGHGMMAKRMRRELVPREPQVSVVTQTIYASSTSTATSVALPTEDPPIPLGPIVGGIAGGVFLVLLVVGGWMWWGSRVRAAKLKSAKTRRAQDLAKARTGHGKTESTETLNTIRSKANSSASHISEKSEAKSTNEPIKKPSAILSEQPKSKFQARPPLNSSSTSLVSSKYAPSRPSPLAAVVTRAPSVIDGNPPAVVVTAPQGGAKGLTPQAAALRSISPLPPALNIVPPSPPPPAKTLLAPAEQRTQRQSVQSVQSVASEYSLDSSVGMAYGGDEMEREAYVNPRDEWRESKKDVMSRMSAAAQARQPDYFSQASRR